MSEQEPELLGTAYVQYDEGWPSIIVNGEKVPFIQKAVLTIGRIDLHIWDGGPLGETEVKSYEHKGIVE